MDMGEEPFSRLPSPRPSRKAIGEGKEGPGFGWGLRALSGLGKGTEVHPVRCVEPVEIYE